MKTLKLKQPPALLQDEALGGVDLHVKQIFNDDIYDYYIGLHFFKKNITASVLYL